MENIYNWGTAVETGKTVYFYALLDEYGLAFYIGQTVQEPPEKRYKQHIREAEGGHNSNKCKMIRNLIERGYEVGFQILEASPPSKYAEKDLIEQEWIGYHVGIGCALENQLLMPKANDATIAIAYEIVTIVLALPEYVLLRSMIIAVDSAIDPTDNLERMKDNLLANIILLVEADAAREQILALCKQNFWEYMQADKEFQQIIKDNCKS